MQKRYYIVLFIVILVSVVFWKVCTYEFIPYDDSIHILKNPYIRNITVSNIMYFWKNPYGELYIPITYTFWAFQAKFATRHDKSETPVSPYIFHAVNFIFHLLNVLLVFIILRILIKDDLASFAGALLFAIHPLQTESVAWISGFKDVFFCFFSLIAVWQYIVYELYSKDSKLRFVHYALATLAFVCAMLAKPTAIVIPAVSFIISYCILKRPFKNIVVGLIPWLVMTIPIIIVTKLSQPPVYLSFIPSVWKRPLIAGDAIMFYLYKLIFPVSLVIDYGRTPKFVLEHGWVYLTGTLPYIFAVVLIWKARTSWIMASAGIFVVVLLPVLGFMPFVFQDISTVADRYIYFAMLGPAIALAWVVSRFKGSCFKVCYVVFFCLIGLKSSFQTTYWQNDFTLYRHTLSVNPDSWVAHTNIGFYFSNNEMLEDAVKHYQEGIRLKPDNFKAYNNLGSVMEKEGDIDQAVEFYTKSLEIRPDWYLVYQNLGRVWCINGNMDKAIDCYKESLKLAPNNPEVLNSLGNIFAKKGDIEKAVTYYLDALKLMPSYAEAHNNLGNVLIKQGKYEEAISHYLKTIELNPNMAEVHNNIGYVMAKQGREKEAVTHYLKALELNPKLAPVVNTNIGCIFEKQGRLDDAIFYYSQALKTDPGFAEAKKSLTRVIQIKQKRSGK